MHLNMLRNSKPYRKGEKTKCFRYLDVFCHSLDEKVRIHCVGQTTFVFTFHHQISVLAIKHTGMLFIELNIDNTMFLAGVYKTKHELIYLQTFIIGNFQPDLCWKTSVGLGPRTFAPKCKWEPTRCYAYFFGFPDVISFLTGQPQVRVSVFDEISQFKQFF